MYNSLLYGSCALKHWFGSDVRPPNDIDIIGKDYDWIPSFQHILDNNIDSQYVDVNFLFTIKCSHAAWDIRWDKTIKDICFMKNKEIEIDKTLFKLLYNDWKYVHGNKKVKMNISNNIFFTGTVTRKYNHDELHKLLAFYDEPLHNKIREDLSRPLCSEDLFLSLSFDDRIKCALEEIHVIATERYVLNGCPFKHAKYKALRQLITSMTTGWFNLFLILNFETLINYEAETWKQKTLNII